MHLAVFKECIGYWEVFVFILNVRVWGYGTARVEVYQVFVACLWELLLVSIFICQMVLASGWVDRSCVLVGLGFELCVDTYSL